MVPPKTKPQPCNMEFSETIFLTFSGHGQYLTILFKIPQTIPQLYLESLLGY